MTAREKLLAEAAKRILITDGAFANAENAYAGNGAAMAEGNEITD